MRAIFPKNASGSGHACDWSNMKVLKSADVKELFAIKNRAMKVLIQSRAAGLKSIQHQLVAILKIGPVEMEFLHSRAPRVAIPTVRQDHAAIVPKQSFDFRHHVLSSYSGLPMAALGRSSIIAVQAPWLKQNSGLSVRLTKARCRMINP